MQTKRNTMNKELLYPPIVNGHHNHVEILGDIHGDVKKCDTIVVEGNIQGDIKHCKNVVIINSTIQGDVKATNIVSSEVEYNNHILSSNKLFRKK